MVKNLFLNDKFILILILLNAIIIFIGGFECSEPNHKIELNNNLADPLCDLCYDNAFARFDW